MPHVIYLHSALTKGRMPVRDDAERRRVLRFERIDVIDRARARRADQPGDAGGGGQAVPRARAAGVDTIQAAHAELGRLVGGGAALAFAVALLASGASSSSVGTYAGQVVMAGFINVRIPRLRAARGDDAAGADRSSRSGSAPTGALVLSQVVLSFGIPFALVPLVMLTSRRDVMGAHVNGRLTMVVAYAVAAAITAMNVFLIVQALFVGPEYASRQMASLAHNFDEIVASLPDDWTDLELDLRIFDERRYVDAAVHAGHRQRRSRTPSTTGTGGSSSPIASGTPRRCPRCTSALKLLDDAGIEGELAVREVRTGRAEVVQMWGRTESVRQEFRKLRAQ